MPTTPILKDTWTPILTAPTGDITFQNQTRGIMWFFAADALPTGTPKGIEYGSMEGESGRLLLDIFPAGGNNLYVYTQLGGPVFAEAA
jgi:hypothetical protein